MRKTLMAAAASAVALAGLASPASAVQAPNDTTFHGTWTSWSHGTSTRSYYGGHWNVSVKEDGTANMSMVLFAAPGRIYTSWGGNVWRSPLTLTSAPGAYPIELLNDLGMHITLESDGDMTFSFTSPQDGALVVFHGSS